MRLHGIAEQLNVMALPWRCHRFAALFARIFRRADRIPLAREQPRTAPKGTSASRLMDWTPPFHEGLRKHESAVAYGSRLADP